MPYIIYSSASLSCYEVDLSNCPDFILCSPSYNLQFLFLWICRIKSTFLSHLYFSLFTICPLTLFPMTAQCFLSPLSASLGNSLNFKLGLILILLFRMPSSFLPSLPADHIHGRAERSQAFLVRTHLDSNPDLATCFVCWPRYLISLNQIFVCKMRALLFHYYKD